MENDQLYLKKKGFSFSERKIILFAISHLESLSAKSSFKSVFPYRKKLLDFLSQAYKSFPSNYEVHAELLDSLSSKIKVSYNELVEEIIMSIESKTSKTSIDYEFIGFFDLKETIEQTTIFRFTHQKQLTPIQEESAILFMSLYADLIKNNSFKSKFSTKFSTSL